MKENININNHHNVNNNHHHHQPIWDFDKLQTFKLFAKDGAVGDNYGHGVAICDNKIIVGSYLDTFRDVQSGTAYVYKMGSTYEWSIQTKLYPSLGQDDDYFGWSISCNKNITVIGSYGVDTYKENGGAVYLFSQDNSKFTELGIFYPPEATKNEYFGWSLAFHEHLLVVGAKGNSQLHTQCGAVYVYRMLDPSQLAEYNNIEHDDDSYKYTPYGWILDEILVPPSQSSYMNFGYSVSIYKNTLVVGAPRAESSSGYVYVYVRNMTYDNYDDDQYYTNEAISYILVSVLQSPYHQAKSMFGNSVSIYGDLIIVGQHLLVRQIIGRDLHNDDEADDDNIYDITSGGAFIFKKDEINRIGSQQYPSSYIQQWGVIVDLGSLVGYVDYELFGSAVAIYHGLIAIGAPGDPVAGINSSIYLYASNSKDYFTWEPLSNWANFDTNRQYGKLGSSIALSEGLVLVGDPKCYNNEIQTGCAFAWWGINNKKDDTGEPSPDIIMSNKYEITWITLLIVSVSGCFLCCFYFYRHKRENIDIILDDILHSSDHQKMEYSQTTNISTEMNSTNYPKWLHRYSTHSTDWLFGGNEMKPIRLGSIDASESSIESGSIDNSQSARGLLSYFQRPSSRENSINNDKSSILSRSSGIPASMVHEYRKKTQSDLKRIMATAKAIADDDSHPNQEDVAELIRTYERDWISDDRFVDEVQKYFI